VSIKSVRIGMRVKVRDGQRNPHLQGLVGTVQRRYGDTYTAVEIWFRDGRRALFWDHELEKAT
jgi:hypothetical protein